MSAVASVRSARRAGVRGSSKFAVGAAEAPLALVGDPLRVAVFVLTLLAVSRVHERYPLLAALRPALLLVMASAAYAYLNPRYLTDANVMRLWPMRLVAALAVLACVSAVFGISLGASATFILFVYVKTILYAFLIAVSIRHARDLLTFVWAYVISCGILAFLSLFVFGITKASTSYVTRLGGLYTYDSNDLCVVMMVGLPLNLLLLTVSRGAKRRSLLVILLGISATMARSGSRGGFLGFIAVGLAALLLVNAVPVWRRLLAVTVTVLALAAGAPPGYWEQMRTILSPKDDYNYTEIDGRKAVMERGIGYIGQYPLFGLGINNFPRAECSISPKLAALRPGGPLRCTPPHNSFLQAGAELGIPGLFIWAGLVFGGILGPLRLRRRLPKSWRRGTETERFIYGATSFFPVAMVGFAVTSFFVSFAWMDPLYILAGFLAGLYVAARRQMREGGGSRGGAPFETVPPASGPGWRVVRSAWRFNMGTRH